MRRYADISIGLVVTLVVTYVLHVSLLGQTFDRAIYDRINVEKAVPSIALVAIDDASLNTFGAWPWDRSVFSDFVDQTKNAKAIGFDVLFLEPRSGDTAFVTSLENGEKTTYIFAGKERQTPLFEKITDRTGTGIVHVIPDDDGVVRYMSSGFMAGDVCRPSFALALLDGYTKSHDVSCDTSRIGFPYVDGFTVYSFKDIVEGRVEAQDITNKILLVGATSLDMGDIFVGASGEKIPGVMIHASYLQSLLTSAEIVNLPTIFQIALLIISLGVVFMISRAKKIFVLVVSFLALLVSLLLTLVLTHTLGYRGAFDVALFAPSIFFGYLMLRNYLRTEKNNKKIQSLFGAYVHASVLETLMKEGSSLSLGGEKKKMTVLFSDIRSFTTYSESVTPEVLVESMNRYFSHMTPAITEQYGTIDKYIGDAIMAFWNAPLPVEHHPKRAVYAALAMLDALLVCNQTYGYSFKIGIGIHTGDAVVGNIGSKERVNYTVLGDTVNVASRIEGLTKEYGVPILVTEDVIKEIDDQELIFTKQGTVQVKGREEPVTLYSVTRKGGAH